MKTRNLITLASAVTLLTACIPSVNPFYTEKDLVFNPSLLGQWQALEKDDSPESWLFEKADNQDYKLTITDKDHKEGQFEARLFKLKEEQFFDLIPHDCSYATNQIDLVGASMFPGHLLVHVSQLEPKLELAFFDFDWLAKYLENNPSALAHRKQGKSLLLTAETRDLQAFVLKHVNECFAKPDALVRATNNAAGTAR